MPDLDVDVLALMRCPVTQTPVRRGSPALLEGLNALITAGTLTNRTGVTVADPMDAVLVNEPGEIALAVRGGIIQLIADEVVTIPESLRSTI